MGEIPITEADPVVVVGEVADFLLAGGRFTWADWQSAPESLRVLAVEAGEMVEQERHENLVVTLIDAVAAIIEDGRLAAVMDAKAREVAR